MIRKVPFLHRFLNKNTQESGRSMVEILGVLAVIGVLTIGGIYGYQLALNKYIANETIHELNMRASNISYKMEKLIEANYVGEIDMELGNVTRWGYPIMARMSPQYIDYFEIFLSDVPSDICKLLLQSHWVAPYSVFVGITEYTGNAQICDSEESVELVYEFYKDMTQKEEIEEENQHKTDRCRHDNDCRCGTCGNGLCVTFCTSEEQCVKDSDNPQQLVCCSHDDVLGELCCNSIEDGKCCNIMGQCCLPETPLWDINGVCHACDEDNLITVENSYLCGSICENRTVMSGKFCSLKCHKNEFKNTLGRCLSCTDAGNYWTMATKAECNKCPERVLGYYQNNKCMLKCNTPGTYTEGKPLHNLDGICFTCITSEKVDMRGGDDSRCKKECPNRILIGQKCFLKDYCTTTEKPLMDENGNCYACNTPQALPKQEKCTTACPTERKVASDGKCVLNTCEKNQFKSNGNTCLSCTDAGNYWTMASKAECDKCPERVLGYYQNNKCMLKCDTPGTYTEGKPLHNLDGICYSCNERSSLNMLGGDSSRCETICPNRTLVGNECVFRECSRGTFSGNDNVCYTCNITTPIATTPTECERCLNRKYGTDGYCSLNNTQS